MIHSPRVGFIGAGNMARALAVGFSKSGMVAPTSMMASDPVPASRDQFTTETGSPTTVANEEVVAESKYVFLCTKPQILPAIMPSIRPADDSGQVYVSIAAGVSLATLEQGLGTRQIIRVMPNTPCLVQQGASAYAPTDEVTEEDCGFVERLLACVGLSIRVPENQLDAVTGLSGSGPAYIFQIIEGLSDGGVQAGLPRDAATQLAAHTMLGAVQLFLQSGKHPGELKDMVASPGGTTIAGIAELERHGLRSALIDAVVAATERSKELGKQ